MNCMFKVIMASGFIKETVTVYSVDLNKYIEVIISTLLVT